MLAAVYRAMDKKRKKKITFSCFRSVHVCFCFSKFFLMIGIRTCELLWLNGFSFFCTFVYKRKFAIRMREYIRCGFRFWDEILIAAQEGAFQEIKIYMEIVEMLHTRWNIAQQWIRKRFQVIPYVWEEEGKIWTNSIDAPRLSLCMEMSVCDVCARAILKPSWWKTTTSYHLILYLGTTHSWLLTEKFQPKRIFFSPCYLCHSTKHLIKFIQNQGMWTGAGYLQKIWQHIMKKTYMKCCINSNSNSQLYKE